MWKIYCILLTAPYSQVVLQTYYTQLLSEASHSCEASVCSGTLCAYLLLFVHTLLQQQTVIEEGFGILPSYQTALSVAQTHLCPPLDLDTKIKLLVARVSIAIFLRVDFNLHPLIIIYENHRLNAEHLSQCSNEE